VASHPSRVVALVLWAAACGGNDNGCKPPLERLSASEPATLGPGKTSDQDEDPNLMVTRQPDALYAAWYSNRLGTHPDGLARKEIFVTRSLDGERWSEPVPATDARAWSFYPSQAREAGGTFRLAWMRWRLLPDGCIYFDAQHCPGDPGCCTGTERRVLVNASFDGLAWDESNAVPVSPGPLDEVPSLLAASDGRLLVYFASGYRAGDTQRRIHVAVRDGTGWHAPVPVTGLATADHDTFPHVVERAPGAFLMAFTRYAFAQGDNLFHSSSETMLSTSTDGLAWTEPVAASGPSADHVDVFPWLFQERNGGWSVLWVREDGTVSLPVEGSFPGDLQTLPLPGYTPRLVRTPTPGIGWAAWVEGTDPTQKVKIQFLER